MVDVGIGQAYMACTLSGSGATGRNDMAKVVKPVLCEDTFGLPEKKLACVKDRHDGIQMNRIRIQISVADEYIIEEHYHIFSQE